MLKKIKPGTKMRHIPTGEIVTIKSGTVGAFYKVVRPDGRLRTVPLSELTAAD